MERERGKRKDKEGEMERDKEGGWRGREGMVEGEEKVKREGEIEGW